MSSPAGPNLNLFSFKGNTRILHLTWVAFFISFFVWFNHAALLGSIRDSLGLTDQEIKSLLILNVALTIPARIAVGMLVDKIGPRRMFAALLIISGILCFFFALAESFQTLALTRFLLGFVGAGFVIGIRLISEWFQAREIGFAEGIYGGWGNFGSAAAAVTLPSVALLFGGEDGWRYAVMASGVVAILYAIVFFLSVSDTPKGSTYFKPKKSGAMEVSSRLDFFLYCAMQAPMILALAVLAWKLGPDNIKLLSPATTYAIYAFLAGLYAYQVIQAYIVNKSVFSEPVAEIHRYKFKQVAVLNLSYFVTFGSELAVVSMLPLFFADEFGLSPVVAGLVGASFATMNLVARPAGGWLSDKYGRKRTLICVLIGITCGYLLMSQIDGSWYLPLVILVTMICAPSGKAGSGAVYAIVPLIKRRLTGQVSGMVGAYGNVGGVCFLTVLSFVTPTIFFLTIAAAALITLFAVIFFLEEPEGQMAEILPDGTVQLIDVT